MQKPSMTSNAMLAASCRLISMSICDAGTWMVISTASISSGLVEYLTCSVLLSPPLTLNAGFIMHRFVLTNLKLSVFMPSSAYSSESNMLRSNRFS